MPSTQRLACPQTAGAPSSMIEALAGALRQTSRPQPAPAEAVTHDPAELRIVPAKWPAGFALTTAVEGREVQSPGAGPAA